MKRVHYLSALTLLFCLLSQVTTGQAPQSFKYQSVARNSAGEPITNSNIGLRISIRDQSETGTIVYQETHTAETNGFGLFSISIGEGAIVTGTFSGINWSSGSKFLEVEADFTGGTSYTIMGVSQLLSVPYALYAASGTAGLQGLPGSNGTNGLNILNGITNPTASIGVNGEFYINTTTSTLFGPKASGVWPAGISLIGSTGAAGTNGANGTNGLNILNGTTDPTAGTGLNGEFYINTTSSLLFGPKTGGIWPTGVSLIGTAGTNGTNGTNGLNILNGTTNPTAGIGVNGEFYINTATSTLFGPKAGGAWPVGVSLVGAAGNSGTNGANGLNILNGTTNPTAGVGVDGEFYINTSNSTLFGPKAGGIWPSGVSLIGAAGTNGINGLNILNGTTNPTAGTGVNGEFYINTATSMLYGPKASGTWPAGVSLIGSAANAWNITGNTGTVDGTHFIGTTDNVPLNFRVNNQKVGRIDATGQTFFGYQAGNLNTGSDNIGVGYRALYSNSTGIDNTAVGFSALSSNTTANLNTAIGYAALNANITGTFNTALGANSLFVNTTASYNTSIGYGSLSSNTIGSGNTATGVYALLSNASGNNNAAYGFRALYNNLGSENTGLGNGALLNNSTGNSNTASGLGALSNNTTGSNNTAIGHSAITANTSTSNLLGIGYKALYSNTAGTSNTAIGYQSLYTNTTATENTAIGYEALYTNNGFYNTALGWHALYSNTSAGQNTAIGHAAMATTTTGFNNTAVGRLALNANTTGSRNTAMGMQALENNTTGTHNVAIGEAALASNNGIENTAIGHLSLGGNTSGNSNTASGRSALQFNTTGNNNTANGYQALYNNTTGANNTALGYQALSTGSTFSNSTAIGYNAQVTVSNMIRLGDANVTSINGAVAFTVVSDGRFKKDVKENVSGLPFIMKLRPVTYHLDMNVMSTFMKTPDSLRNLESERAKEKVLQTGFIAQEVEKSAKELGYDFSGIDRPQGENGYYGLRYSEFTVPLVKAVQEQQKLIETLRAEIEGLKTENNTLKESIENRLKNLEAALGTSSRK